MTDRRHFLIGLGTLGGAALLASCGPAGPGAVTVTATGAAGMNPGPDGADRPLTLQIVQLRGAGSFDTADFFAMQDPATSLAADFIKADQIALAPGATVSKSIGLDPGVTVIGVIAGFRSPAGKVFRAKVPVSATSTTAITITLGAGGISLGSA